MLAHPNPSENAISRVIDRIYRSGKITRADEQYFLMAMVAENPLTREQQHQVRDITQRLQMGLLKVVD